jgi:hypothetical protein
VLPTLSLGANLNGTSDINGSQLQLAGQSLGSIDGLPALSVVSLQTGMANSPYLSGLLSVAGGVFGYIGRDSPSFAPRINAALAALSGGLIVPGTTLYDNFARNAQTAIDSGDPINYAAAAVAGRPILIQQVVGGGLLPDSTAALPDQVVPNGNTRRLLAAANFKRYAAGQTPLPAASGAYVNFVYGMHGSLLLPTGTSNTAATNGAAWSEMQTEAVAFALARGQVVTVANPGVVQP